VRLREKLFSGAGGSAEGATGDVRQDWAGAYRVCLSLCLCLELKWCLVFC